MSNPAKKIYEPNITISEALFLWFSDCPLASDCYGYGYYAPDCENGRLKPKCLSLIREDIYSLDTRLLKLEKLLDPQAEERLD